MRVFCKLQLAVLQVTIEKGAEQRRQDGSLWNTYDLSVIVVTDLHGRCELSSAHLSGTTHFDYIFGDVLFQKLDDLAPLRVGVHYLRKT